MQHGHWHVYHDAGSDTEPNSVADASSDTAANSVADTGADTGANPVADANCNITNRWLVLYELW
jgi:hypothetical protein